MGNGKNGWWGNHRQSNSTDGQSEEYVDTRSEQIVKEYRLDDIYNRAYKTYRKGVTEGTPMNRRAFREEIWEDASKIKGLLEKEWYQAYLSLMGSNAKNIPDEDRLPDVLPNAVSGLHTADRETEEDIKEADIGGNVREILSEHAGIPSLPPEPDYAKNAGIPDEVLDAVGIAAPDEENNKVSMVSDEADSEEPEQLFGAAVNSEAEESAKEDAAKDAAAGIQGAVEENAPEEKLSEKMAQRLEAGAVDGNESNSGFTGMNSDEEEEYGKPYAAPALKEQQEPVATDAGGEKESLPERKEGSMMVEEENRDNVCTMDMTAEDREYIFGNEKVVRLLRKSIYCDPDDATRDSELMDLTIDEIFEQLLRVGGVNKNIPYIVKTVKDVYLHQMEEMDSGVSYKRQKELLVSMTELIRQLSRFEYGQDFDDYLEKKIGLDELERKKIGVQGGPGGKMAITVEIAEENVNEVYELTGISYPDAVRIMQKYEQCTAGEKHVDLLGFLQCFGISVQRADKREEGATFFCDVRERVVRIPKNSL